MFWYYFILFEVRVQICIDRDTTQSDQKIISVPIKILNKTKNIYRQAGAELGQEVEVEFIVEACHC